MYHPHAANSRHENRGAASASSGGTLIGASGTAKGSWVDLGGATSFAYEAITVAVGGNGNASNYVIDIGVSDGSNRYTIAEDLYFAALKQTLEHSLQIYIPVHVAAGAQLSARCSASVSGAQTDIVVIGHSSGLGGAPGFSRCVALFTSASSRGIAVDPGGTANTKGSWAEITSSCPNDIAAMFGLIGNNGDVSRAATAVALVDIGIGAAASEFVLYPNALVGWGLNRDGPANCPRIPLFAANVPSGTRIAARAQCSINTAGDRTVDLALYGLVR